MDEPFVKDLLTDAVRYREPRRIPYNLVLAAIVAGWFVYLWPYSAAGDTIDTLLFVFILAVLANVCYCAAYPVDVAIQLSKFRPLWLRYHWALFGLGLLFASAVTYFFARFVFVISGL